MKSFYIADMHFGHKNILSYDNRPFRDIEEHDAALIEKWNSVVSEDDRVYILGDVSWYNAEKTSGIMESLNGTKYLICGNHDKKYLNDKRFTKCFHEIAHYKEYRMSDGKLLILSHYPIPCFNGHFQGNVHLYGHVHNSFEWNMMQRVKYEMENLYERPCRMFNVGAMIGGIDYTPRTVDEIISTFEGDCSNKENILTNR